MTAADMEVPFSFMNTKLIKKYGILNNGVLEGNWFEDRVILDDKKNEKSGTAVKLLKPCDLCCFGEKYRFRMPNHGLTKDQNIRAHRVNKLEREQYRERSNMKDCLDDGGGFKDNMTSTYTLDFVLHRRSNYEDRLQSYGNLSPSGLQSWKYCMANARDIRCCHELMRTTRTCGKPSAALREQTDQKKEESPTGSDRQNCGVK